MAKEKKEKPKQKRVIKKATKSKAKKKWVSLLAPKSFDSRELGESHVENPEKLVGKSITVNLMHLTNDMRNQGVEIKFKVARVVEGKGQTVVTGYEVLPGQMKRVVRRGRSKVADSFVVRCGQQLVRVKPMTFTANRASAGAQSAIRMAVRAKIKQLLAKMSFDQLIHELIGYKLQRTLKDVAMKSHPIKSVEIKACSLIPEGGKGETTVEEVERASAPAETSAETTETSEAKEAPEEVADAEADKPAEEAAAAEVASEAKADEDAAEKAVEATPEATKEATEEPAKEAEKPAKETPVEDKQ